MNVRRLVIPAAAALGAAFWAAPAMAQSLSPDAGARRPPALGRVSPAPSIYSNRTRSAPYAPSYRRPSRVCRIRTVREWNGDRFVEHRYEVCRERW